VHEREQPDGEVEVVRTPPEAVREPLAVVVGHGQSGEELRGDDAERDRKRAVRRRPGDQELTDRERQIAVEEQRPAVHDHESAGQQAEEPVHVFESEAGDA
jgi:hypothetical protein